MPDFHWNDGTDWVGEGGTFYKLGCDYRLVVDNLMDLTHETYVHVGSIGDEAITGTPFEVSHTDHTATVTRWMINIDPPPFWAAQLGRPGRSIAGRSSISRRPRLSSATSAWPHRDGRAARRSLAGRQRRVPRRDHAGDGADLSLFLELRRTFKKEDAQLTREIQRAHVNNGQGVYDQDVTVLEAQQKAIDRNPRMPFYNLNIDAGALWARRMIDRLLASEHGQSARPPGVAAE